MNYVRPFYSQALVYVAIASALLPIFIGIKRRRILWWYVLLSFGVDVVFGTLPRFGIPTKFDDNAWNFVEFFAIGQYYILNLLNVRYIRKASIVFTAVVASLFLLFLSMGWLSVEHNLVSGIQASICLLLALIGLFKVIRDIEYEKLEDSHLFTSSAGFLIYFSGIIYIEWYHDYLVAHINEISTFVFYIRPSVIIIKHLAIARVLYLQGRKSLARA